MAGLVWNTQEGLTFRTAKESDPIEGNNRIFSRKDDVRNWHLSDEGIIGITSKLYGNRRNVALIGSANDFQIRKNTYTTGNLKFDIERWRKDHLRPSDRFTTGKKKIAKVTKALEPRLMNFLYKLFEEYDQETFSEHVSCEKAQTEILEYRGVASWPVFCVFGLVRMAIKEAWIYQRRAYYEDEI